MNREELIVIYKEMEDRIQKIMAPLTSLHKRFDLSCGYFLLLRKV